MRRIQVEQGSDEWLALRRGKITGTRLKDIIVKRGTGRKLGFYEILAERLSSDSSDVDDPMQRGSDLENEAVGAFQKLTGKEVAVDTGVWVSDDNSNIMVSPDGEIGKTEAIEVKCLSSARHLQAHFEKKVPDDYEEQTVQYFIVNEKLKTLYVVFYDPRITYLPIHFLEIHREDIEEKIEAWKQYQIDTLAEIDSLVTQLTF